ncbi:MAG TPA: T9SS type A sorting domain-containing protein, partial [Chitinophagales bacterium]
DTIILTSLYTSDSIPDSLFIEFRSSANSTNAQLGSRLWIDNIRLRIDSANLPVGIATVSEDGISVYPNPSSDILFIDLDENFANSELEIFDLQGRLLLTQKGISGKNALKTTNFDTGFCVLLVRLPDEQSVFRKRFLITR